MSQAARKLYDTYLKVGCIDPINIDSIAQQKIDELVKTEKFTADMFNYAQSQVDDKFFLKNAEKFENAFYRFSN